MRKKLIIIVFALISGVSFAAERKGFILGIGAGGSSIALTQKNGSQSTKNVESGLATNFKIGYAPTDELEIYWSSKVAWFNLNSSELIAGVAGLGVTKYFGGSAPCPFVSVGAGYANIQDYNVTQDQYLGTGLYLGVGYELIEHVNVELDMLYSTDAPFTNDNNWKADLTAIMLTINAEMY